jgi:hypothetical protein
MPLMSARPAPGDSRQLPLDACLAGLSQLQSTSPASEAVHQPQWVRPTEGEPLRLVALAVAAAAGRQLSVPAWLALHSGWLLPALCSGC